MKIVGEQLEVFAKNCSIPTEQDLFCRSAFNRFYYSAFLITRETLGDLKQSWKKQKHKSIPELLVKGVRDPVSTELDKLVKKNVITEGERSRILTSLKNATSDLSNLLKEGYDVRCIADYEPEVLISIQQRNFLLNNYNLSSAKLWPGRASANCKVIRKAWEDCGLA
jgi:hypothetical protein